MLFPRQNSRRYCLRGLATLAAVVMAVALLLLPVPTLLKTPLLLLVPRALLIVSLPQLKVNDNSIPKLPTTRALLPLVVYLALFCAPQWIPKSWLPTPSTQVLPAIDSFLFGRPLNEFFDNAENQSTTKDLVAWVLYGVWHYVSPLMAAIVLVVWGWRRHRAVLHVHMGVHDFLPSHHRHRQRRSLIPDNTDDDDDRDDNNNDSDNDDAQDSPGVLVTTIGAGHHESLRMQDLSQRSSPIPGDALTSVSASVSAAASPAMLSPPLSPARRSSRTGSPLSRNKRKQPSVKATRLFSGRFHSIFVVPSNLVATMFWTQLDLCLAVTKLFLIAFGVSNSLGVLIQMMFPTAPPWYIEKYGIDSTPSYDTVGDPAGLARIDTYFNMTMYHDMFRHSPVVFGAFPSLHSAFATSIALFCVEVCPHLYIPVLRLQILRDSRARPLAYPPHGV
ncbi:hypothetical protein RI367_005811 [Sorochytrium milnesiophthora]